MLESDIQRLPVEVAAQEVGLEELGLGPVQPAEVLEHLWIQRCR